MTSNEGFDHYRRVLVYAGSLTGTGILTFKNLFIGRCVCVGSLLLIKSYRKLYDYTKALASA